MDAVHEEVVHRPNSDAGGGDLAGGIGSGAHDFVGGHEPALDGLADALPQIAAGKARRIPDQETSVVLHLLGALHRTEIVGMAGLL